MTNIRKTLARPKIPAGDQPNYYLLLATTAFLVICGLGILASASSYAGANANGQAGDAFYYFKRQAIAIMIGAFVLTIMSRISYKQLKNIAPAILAISIVLLVGLFIAPSHLTLDALGARRGYQLGAFSFQPSELAKAAVAIWVVGAALSLRAQIKNLGAIFRRVLVWAGLVAGLIVFQPDLGSASLVCMITLLGLLFAGIKFREFSVIVGSLGIIGLSFILLEPYRFSRLIGFLDPSGNASDEGFQLMQGLYAIGSGGLTGVGYFGSHQKFGFIPAVHTDFIFAVVGEETGLIGATLLLLAFVVFITAGMRISSRAGDVYAKNLAMVITSFIGLQIVINLACVLGMMPITGVPLPLISYGGSSMIVTLGLVGILLNIAATSNVKKGVRREKNSENGWGDRRTSGTGARSSASARRTG